MAWFIEIVTSPVTMDFRNKMKKKKSFKETVYL